MTCQSQNRRAAHGFTDAWGTHGPYHYYLDLSLEDAQLVVALCHKDLLQLQGNVEELVWNYAMVRAQRKCPVFCLCWFRAPLLSAIPL